MHLFVHCLDTFVFHSIDVNSWSSPFLDAFRHKLSLFDEWRLGLVAEEQVIAALETAQRVPGCNGFVFEDEVGDGVWHEQGAGRRHDENGLPRGVTK